VTPQLVTGIWTGCEDRDFHFRSSRLGEGSNSALPIFAYTLKRFIIIRNWALKDIDFEPPKAPLTITLDCNAYTQQTKGTMMWIRSWILGLDINKNLIRYVSFRTTRESCKTIMPFAMYKISPRTSFEMNIKNNAIAWTNSITGRIKKHTP